MSVGRISVPVRTNTETLQHDELFANKSKEANQQNQNTIQKDKERRKKKKQNHKHSLLLSLMYKALPDRMHSRAAE